MDEEIQEKLQEFYNNLIIEVKYIKIKTYNIKIIQKDYDIEDISRSKGIIRRCVSFVYKWGDLWTFSSNIQQIKYSIDKYFKLYLESEVNNENN